MTLNGVLLHPTSYIQQFHRNHHNFFTLQRQYQSSKQFTSACDFLGAYKYFSKNCETTLLMLLFSCSVSSDSFVISWTVAHQTPLSMGFPRHEYWSALPFPSPGDLPDPGTEPISPQLQVNYLPLSLLGSLWDYIKTPFSHNTLLFLLSLKWW